MIIPNLMVSDVLRSAAFYRDELGLAVTFAVTADRRTHFDGTVEGAVFAVLEWNGAQLMLQDARSLAEELPVFGPTPTPTPGGTVYFRGMDPDAVAARIEPSFLIKGPETSWYGMRETYFRDPDGHILCAGAPAGPPPGGVSEREAGG